MQFDILPPAQFTATTTYVPPVQIEMHEIKPGYFVPIKQKRKRKSSVPLKTKLAAAALILIAFLLSGCDPFGIANQKPKKDDKPPKEYRVTLVESHSITSSGGSYTIKTMLLRDKETGSEFLWIQDGNASGLVRIPSNKPLQLAPVELKPVRLQF